ncbi:asparagine synthase C-terminal domain-containing protein [Micromonospora sp. CPCC 206171]|uniref:asparagine synthase C-terminal domain-containing protein n=1 Tax=Micromonospora sp. CPCC 206171 TaxID=3122405 RepID=UPI002FF316F3
MIFAMYRGPGQLDWRRQVEEHARWLGLVSAYVTYGAVTCAQLSKLGESPAISQIGDVIRLRTTRSTAANAMAIAASEPAGNDIWIDHRLGTDTVQVHVPPATPEQLVFRAADGGFCLSNDLRLLGRIGCSRLDRRAVHALLQYGAIPAPLTLLSGVERAAPGHVTSIDLSSGVATAAVNHLQSPKAVDGIRFDRCLDVILDTAPKGSVLTFSGGVDSGLLAARLSALGRTDVCLLNFSFGDADPEAKHAAAMARHFHLNFEQTTYESTEMSAFLADVGRDYTYPFGDFATISANLMVRAGIKMAPDAPQFIDGTGADGAFGVGQLATWQRLYRLPRPLLSGAAGLYSWAGLWRRPSRFEHRTRALRRAAQMPLLEAAVVATNALDGVLYRLPPPDRAYLSRAIRTYIIDCAPSTDVRDQYQWLDLLHVCAGEYAAKSFDPLRMRGVRASFPFLEPDLLAEAFAMPREIKYTFRDAKLALKNSLAASVPAELVYRPKSGFVPPLDRWLTEEPLRGVVQRISAEPGALADYLEITRLRRIVERAAEGQPLTQGVRNFVWMVTFLKLWLDQQPWFAD